MKKDKINAQKKPDIIAMDDLEIEDPNQNWNQVYALPEIKLADMNI